jgi:predicted PurR-regulated permease PerM
MAEPDRNGISARLWKIPRQLLLALINATAILVIVAAVLAIVAMTRISHFADHIAATMTEAVLAKVGLPPKRALANLQELTAEVRTLGNTLRQIKAGEHPVLQSDIEQLKQALTAVNSSVDRLGNAKSILTDEAIEQLGRTVTDTLMKLRDCSPGPRQASLGNKTVAAWEEQTPMKSGLHQRRSELSSALRLE